MTTPSPERRGSPSNSPSGVTIAVEASARDRFELAVCVLHNLGLLVGIQPSGSVYNKTGRFEARAGEC